MSENAQRKPLSPSAAPPEYSGSAKGRARPQRRSIFARFSRQVHEYANPDENHASYFDASPKAAASTGLEEASDADVITRDAEIIVALFRAVVLMAAVFGARFLTRNASLSGPLLWLAAAAAVYTTVVLVGCFLPRGFGLRRPLVVAMDMMLITLWMRLGHQWDLFPLYYIVVIVAAMWFRVFGGVLTAIFCNFFFLFLWMRRVVEFPDLPPTFSPVYMLNMALLMLVACLVGFIAEAQDNERVRRLEGQLLVANYQREIDIAAQMQSLLIPSQWMSEGDENAPPDETTDAATDVRVLAPLSDRAMQLGAAMKPARAFGGGDYFDVIPLSGGRTALCIADVSGKSVRAQARLPLLKYSLRALAPLYTEPGVLVRRLNETLAPDLQDELFIGLCYVVLDPRHERLTWCNAGHIPPLLFPEAANFSAKESKRETRRAAQEYERTLETSVKNTPPEMVSLGVDGPALGPFPEYSYTSQSMPWRNGDRLLLFTDGLSDALSYGGTEDGEEQIAAMMRSSQSNLWEDQLWEDASALARHLVNLGAMALESTEHPRRDDMTVVIARCTAKPRRLAASRSTREQAEKNGSASDENAEFDARVLEK